mmetsp:Transcript_10431/g.32340  ORF Transcript_10431/g.32340 Transcript_10431/m.32340 type:complete len:545 (+) Transcript_10431:738-2372(+)
MSTPPAGDGLYAIVGGALSAEAAKGLADRVLGALYSSKTDNEKLAEVVHETTRSGARFQPDGDTQQTFPNFFLMKARMLEALKQKVKQCPSKEEFAKWCVASANVISDAGATCSQVHAGNPIDVNSKIDTMVEYYQRYCEKERIDPNAVSSANAYFTKKRWRFEKLADEVNAINPDLLEGGRGPITEGSSLLTQHWKYNERGVDGCVELLTKAQTVKKTGKESQDYGEKETAIVCTMLEFTLRQMIDHGGFNHLCERRTRQARALIETCDETKPSTAGGTMQQATFGAEANAGMHDDEPCEQVPQVGSERRGAVGNRNADAANAEQELRRQLAEAIARERRAAETIRRGSVAVRRSRRTQEADRLRLQAIDRASALARHRSIANGGEEEAQRLLPQAQRLFSHAEASYREHHPRDERPSKDEWRFILRCECGVQTERRCIRCRNPTCGACSSSTSDLDWHLRDLCNTCVRDDQLEWSCHECDAPADTKCYGCFCAVCSEHKVAWHCCQLCAEAQRTRNLQNALTEHEAATKEQAAITEQLRGGR